MIRLACHSSLLGGIVLLTFLFSANGLLFGSHLAEELLVQTAQAARGGEAIELLCGKHSVDHHHDHRQHAHAESECCDAHGPHSHDLRSGQPLIDSPLLSFSPQRFYDGAIAICEVYLERFVPPQNPA